MGRLIQSKRSIRGAAAILVLLSIVTVAITPYIVEGQSVEESKTKPRSIDILTYSTVQAIRSELGLANDDMALLDLSEERAEGVLVNLVEWAQRNQSRLDAALSKEREAERALRETQRAIRVGPRNERLIQSVAAQSESLSSNRLARRSLQEEGARYALAGVTADQLGLWESVNVRSSQVAISKSQRQLIDDYHAVKSHRSKSPGVSEGFRSENSQTRTFREARVNRLSGVQAAERRVMPTPAELTEAFDASLLLDENGRVLDP